MQNVNLYEQPIMPVVDFDSEVVVYVPGYAIKGPGDPTLVNASNFTAIFGDSAYIFTGDQDATLPKNKVLKGGQEKSWVYAKGLVDSGLTILYHRFKPTNAPYAKVESGFTPSTSSSIEVTSEYSIGIRAKYFGTYYKGLKVTMTAKTNGVFSVVVTKGADTTALELYNAVLNKDAENYLPNLNFAYIEFYGYKYFKTTDTEIVSGKTYYTIEGAGTAQDPYTYEPVEIPTVEGLSTYYEEDVISIDEYCDLILNLETPAVYIAGTGTLTTSADSDNFSVSSFESALASGTGAFKILEDTENYPVTYITTGGYFVGTSSIKPTELIKTAEKVKAVAAVDFEDSVTSSSFSTYQTNITAALAKGLADSFGFQVLGCDTFLNAGKRILLPDSYGYFTRLGYNISNGIPAWLPIANNSNGIVSSGVAATRPVDYTLENMMISDIGKSINPIVTKKNIGYVIMGNRTLYTNEGVLGPQSFLNCRLVVNGVERSARTSANKLRIVSTNPETAFKTFKNDVSKTCDKYLSAGDGLAEYSIIKLPKTAPATLDIQIRLVVVEGIEKFNIYIPYSIALD